MLAEASGNADGAKDCVRIKDEGCLELVLKLMAGMCDGQNKVLQVIRAEPHIMFLFSLLNSCARIKRPLRDACLCMGDLQAPPAPHFVFLITL